MASDAATSVESTDFLVPATDDRPLAATLHAPPPPARKDAIVIVAGATGVPRAFYARFARYLARHGFTVLTFDYRGIGGSARGRADRHVRMSDWGTRDLAGVLDWTLEHASGARVLVIGHSVGGQILGLAPRAREVAGLLAIGAMNPHWRHWPGLAKARMALVWHAVLPTLARAFRGVPEWVGVGALPEGVAREWAWWGRSRDHLFRDDTTARRAAFARFTGALAAWSFADDAYAPEVSVDAFLEYYPHARAPERRHVAPADVGADAIGHFGFFRERFWDALWADAVRWLDAHAAARRADPADAPAPAAVT